jgi:AcrR family transcriptional regulator
LNSDYEFAFIWIELLVFGGRGVMEPIENLSHRSKWRERERQRGKMVILAAAAELFAQFGYEGTSMKQIAERAELSVGKLYTHFKGKEEIFRELLEAYIKELHSMGDRACNPHDPPLKQLRCRLEAAIEHFKKNINLVLIYHNENPLKLKGIIKKEVRNNREIVADLISRAIARGDIPPEDPHVLAALVIGAVHGLMHVLTESDGGDALDAVPGIINRIILSPLEMKKTHASGMEES